MMDSKKIPYWIKGGLIYLALYFISLIGMSIPFVGFIFAMLFIILSIPLVPVQLLALYLPITLVVLYPVSYIVLILPGVFFGLALR